MRRPTILLADDHPMMCAALREMLAPDHDVIGCVQDGRTLVNSAAELKPDLVVLDVGLPVLNGLDAGRQLKSSMPGIRLVFLSMNRDPEIAREAYRIGASGYVLKDAMGEELLHVIQDAMRRGV
jgi:DNA-binding NarL/FixJ family response regulator